MAKTSTEEQEDFLKSGRKLGEWTEEEIDVTVIKPIVDAKNNRVVFKTDTEKQNQKVYYSSSTPRMIICGKHFFLPLEPKKYLFKCKNCDYHYQAQIPTHKYNPITGELSHRKSGTII